MVMVIISNGVITSQPQLDANGNVLLSGSFVSLKKAAGTNDIGLYERTVGKYPFYAYIDADGRVRSFAQRGNSSSTIVVSAGFNAEVTKTATANVRNSHNAVATSTSATYEKVKTISLDYGLRGQARWLFDIKNSDNATTVYGRIYKNGVALGTEQSTASNVYATKSQDITNAWVAGDTAELWIHSDGAVTVSVQNFQIAYDDSPTVAVSATNS